MCGRHPPESCALSKPWRCSRQLVADLDRGLAKRSGTRRRRRDPSGPRSLRRRRPADDSARAAREARFPTRAEAHGTSSGAPAHGCARADNVPAAGRRATRSRAWPSSAVTISAPAIDPAEAPQVDRIDCGCRRSSDGIAVDRHVAPRQPAERLPHAGHTALRDDDIADAAAAAAGHCIDAVTSRRSRSKSRRAVSSETGNRASPGSCSLASDAVRPPSSTLRLAAKPAPDRRTGRGDQDDVGPHQRRLMGEQRRRRSSTARRQVNTAKP